MTRLLSELYCEWYACKAKVHHTISKNGPVRIAKPVYGHIQVYRFSATQKTKPFSSSSHKLLQVLGSSLVTPCMARGLTGISDSFSVLCATSMTKLGYATIRSAHAHSTNDVSLLRR